MNLQSEINHLERLVTFAPPQLRPHAPVVAGRRRRGAARLRRPRPRCHGNQLDGTVSDVHPPDLNENQTKAKTLFGGNTFSMFLMFWTKL